MAERLNRMLAWGAAAVLLLPGWCCAESLPDPTRPPDAASTVPAAPGEKAAVEWVLQSVMISPGRKAAIINGQYVLLGEAVGNAKLVKVGEGEVVLQAGDKRIPLRLFPGVEKSLRGKRMPAGPESGERKSGLRK